MTTDRINSGKCDERTLRRLETLLDSVFALVLVLVVLDLPRPEGLETADLGAFVSTQAQGILQAAIGMVVVLTYWIQSNTLCGNLAGTDNKHASFMVVQVAFVLFYLYAVGLGTDIGNDPKVLALQSTGAALIGVFTALAWTYASKNRRLLNDTIDNDEVRALRLRVLAEPLTAATTLPLAFVSATVWELGWLAYPLLAYLLNRSRWLQEQ
jgi:uncharacterized membrane protein